MTYTLRPNNYKKNLLAKFTADVVRYFNKLEANKGNLDVQINCVYRIYLLLNKNIDLCNKRVNVLDLAYLKISSLSVEINKRIEQYPDNSRTGRFALLQLQKYKKYYENYWANITDSLNSRTCEDMTRVILSFVH